MGRNSKDYREVHIKCDKRIYERLEKYVDGFNRFYDVYNSRTVFIEDAIYEYLEVKERELKEEMEKKNKAL